ncbi:MAG: GAF domain-containing sensor histidine kinase [Labilithrix sp.]|nr:GAF domain-containing sensor histidine kinase [Labilithrix sp.]
MRQRSSVREEVAPSPKACVNVCNNKGGTMAALTTPGHTSTESAISAVAMLAFASAHEAAQAIFRLINDFFGMRICVLSRVDVVSNTLTVLDACDRAGLGIAQGMVVPADEMPCDFVVKSATALRHADLEDHPVFSRLPICAALGVRSYIGVPLRRSDGTIWGTLAASDTEPRETTDAELQTLVLLGRLVAYEFEREEHREAVAAHARELEARLAAVHALEEERLRTVRLQAVLEAAATVSHEVNNPLTVLQLRLSRLAKRCRPSDKASREDLDVAFEVAHEIHQVTVRLRKVVRPVSTTYLSRDLSGDARMLDLTASIEGDCAETG